METRVEWKRKDGVYQPFVSGIQQANTAWPDGFLSVTSVLPSENLSHIPWKVLKRASERGSAVHEATHLLDISRNEFSVQSENEKPKSSPWSDEISHLIKPYMVGYKRFLNDKNPSYDLFETVVVSNKYGFAGRFDRLGLWGDQPAIFDIKTGMTSSKESLQMAAYLLAYGEERNINVDDFLRLSIHLSKDGNYSVLRWASGDDLRRDMDLYISFVDTHRWKAKNNLLESNHATPGKSNKSQTEILTKDMSVLDNPSLERKLDELEELKNQKTQYGILERSLKNHFEGFEGQQRIGKWIIECKKTERTYHSKPAQESRITKGWSTKFIRVL